MSCRHFLRSRGKCTVFSSDQHDLYSVYRHHGSELHHLIGYGSRRQHLWRRASAAGGCDWDLPAEAEPGEGCIPVTVFSITKIMEAVWDIILRYYFTVNGTDVISIMRDDILQGRSQAYWKVDQHTLHFFDKETEANIGYPEE